jgi:vacuolar-type H+-ATPase subunit H
MPSRDILDKLFEVERQAEAIVQEASQEATRRVANAKDSADNEFKSAYEAAAHAAEEARRKAERDTDTEQETALAEYRSKLELARLDRKGFAEACERFIAEAL